MQQPRLTFSSFCRKTTLTKHARRAHRISTDNQYSDDDSSGSDSEDSPVTEPQETPEAHWLGQSRSASQSNGQAGYAIHRPHSVMDFKPERMTPFSPQVSHSATNRPTISDTFSFPTNPVMHADDISHGTVTHPMPISQGAVYATQQCETVLSPTASIPRTMNQNYGPIPMVHHYPSAGHRLEASATPTPQHVHTAAQTIQSSPSSMSSCSSQPESANSHDLYYAQVQSLPMQQYQLQPAPINHDATLQYHQYQPVSLGQQTPHGQAMAPPSMPSQQYHTIPQPQQQEQEQQQPPPQVWYDTMAYLPPVMVSAPEPINQPRLYTPGNGVQDWWIKQEDNGMLLPSARLSNF
ncbi:MAG: hypothetical protein M1830_002253 [Pleopsidium flavum]|nr:MAG: hypothetical protein M1830_002253 [Pleopsidium flavum]